MTILKNIFVPLRTTFYELRSNTRFTRTFTAARGVFRLISLRYKNVSFPRRDRFSTASRKTWFHSKFAGFTLIETLVAISLLVMAIAAPLSLASQSLRAAFYTRDQMTASHLAQEAIEAIRNVRDGNILRTIYGNPTDLLRGIPDTNGEPFIVDALEADVSQSMELCGGECVPMRSNGELFGYEETSGWEDTRFIRTVRAYAINSDEVRIEVEVRWQTGSYQERAFTISENLYRWVDDA